MRNTGYAFREDVWHHIKDLIKHDEVVIGVYDGASLLSPDEVREIDDMDPQYSSISIETNYAIIYPDMDERYEDGDCWWEYFYTRKNKEFYTSKNKKPDPLPSFKQYLFDEVEKGKGCDEFLKGFAWSKLGRPAFAFFDDYDWCTVNKVLHLRERVDEWASTTYEKRYFAVPYLMWDTCDHGIHLFFTPNNTVVIVASKYRTERKDKCVGRRASSQLDKLSVEAQQCVARFNEMTKERFEP